MAFEENISVSRICFLFLYVALLTGRYQQSFGFIDRASGYFVEDNLEMTLFSQEEPVEYEPQYLTDAHQEQPFFIYLVRITGDKTHFNAKLFIPDQR